MLWNLIARIVSTPRVADWLIVRAQRTPYSHLPSNDDPSYMRRWWLFNPYPSQSDGGRRRWGDWLPSVRVHHIVREDYDRHQHDHPWDARTIILRGWYNEVRGEQEYVRMRGDTATLSFGEYHTITKVIHGGVWTLFITYRYRGTWGFLVDGVKVPWRKYLGL